MDECKPLSRQQRWYQANREAILEKKRQQRQQNPALHNDRARQSRLKKYDYHLEVNKMRNRASRAALKMQAIERLGGVCLRSGYSTDIRALQIDHIMSDGVEDRKSVHQWQLYKQIIAFGAQGKYQVLCANCNQIKRMEAAEHPPGRRRKT